MIQHIVMFKFQEENKKQNIKEVQIALEKLPSMIHEIKYFEVGINIVESPAAMDMVLISHFSDIESLDRYRVHPEHQKVFELIKSTTSVRTVVDFES